MLFRSAQHPPHRIRQIGLARAVGADWGGDAAIVESYISYLRKKVDGIEVDDGEGGKRKVTPLIETKRGIGYMIREPKN